MADQTAQQVITEAMGKAFEDSPRGADAQDIVMALREAKFAIVRVPEIAHKGPHDTDGTLLIMAADRLEAGFRPGGSHVTQAVVRVLREVSAGAN